MSQALSDYFVQEAGEYLAELERLLREEPVPDAERIFRLARGIRGSAQVAQADGVAEVAARLEGSARFVLEGRIPWSEDLRQRVVRTVADLRLLLAHPGREWGVEEDAIVQSAVTRWGGFGDVARSPSPLPPGDAVFSFVRTELAGTLAALDRAISALDEDPGNREPLETVSRRLRTLRGVAGSELLAPVMEVVEGCDELLRALSTDQLPGEDPLHVLAAASEALRTAAGALERGEIPPVSGTSLNGFRALRARLSVDPERFGDPNVISICSLFFDDPGPTVVSSPIAPPSPAMGALASPEVEAFFHGEAASLLDSSDGLLAGAEMHAGTDAAAVVRRLADLTGALGDLADTYRLTAAAAATRRAEAELRAATSTHQARATLAWLRPHLLPAAAAGGGRGVWAPAASPSPSSEAAVETVGAGQRADTDPVPIENLLLRGNAALEAALDLRPRVDGLLGERSPLADPLHELLQELWELIELARDR
jgi:HPt (histidine-containing phosphotransfer) domain-containing protein